MITPSTDVFESQGVAQRCKRSHWLSPSSSVLIANLSFPPNDHQPRKYVSVLLAQHTKVKLRAKDLKDYEGEENSDLAYKQDSTTHFVFCLVHGIIFKIEKLNIYSDSEILIHIYGTDV